MGPVPFLDLDTEVNWDKMTHGHEQVFLVSQPRWLYADCLLEQFRGMLWYKSELDLRTVWDCANAVDQKYARECF